MLTARERLRSWSPDAAFFVIVLLLLVTWLVGMPRWASPDEPAHVFKAYGTAHGQLLGDPVPAYQLPDNYRRYDGPPSLGIGDLRCYVGDPDKPAGCEGARNPDLISSAATYPPYYYAVVGGATRITGTSENVYAYRFASAVLCAFALAAAFALLRRSTAPRLAPLMLVGLTPMALFMLGSVNPSGFEIAGFVLVWALLVRVSTDDEPSKRFVLALSLVAATLVLSRPISAGWLVCVAVIGLITMAPARRKELLHWPYVVRLVVPIAISALASLVWLRYANFEVADERVVANLTLRQVVRSSVDQMPLYYREAIGILGWVDTRLPWMTYVGWTLALVLVAVIYLGRAGVRSWLAALAVVAAWLASPIAINLATSSAGLSFQGRYSLPILAGFVFLPMLGPRPKLSTRTVESLMLAALVLVSIAEIAGFWQMLRRFGVGEDGKIWLTGSMPWQPGVTPMLLVAFNAAAMIGLCVGAVTMSRQRVADDPVAAVDDADGDIRLQITTA